MSYAAKTTVSQERSKAEIEKTLTKYGASKFGYGWNDDTITIGFQMQNRMVQFKLKNPEEKDLAYSRSGNTSVRLEQAKRQRWRALALVIKAKLEAVESGITEFEQEFLAHILLPNKQTVGEWLQPQIESAYENRKMPKLFLGSGE